MADIYLNHFASGVVQLFFGKDDKKRKAEQSRLKEMFYAEVNNPFRSWLQDIHPDQTKMEQTIRTWENTAHDIGVRVIRSYMESFSDNLYKTKEIDGKVVSVPSLLNLYFSGLRKVYAQK